MQTESTPGAEDPTGSRPTFQAQSDRNRQVHGHRRRNPIRRFARRLRKLLKPQVIIIALLIVVIVPSAIGVAFVADANVRIEESTKSLKRILSTLEGRSISDFTTADVDRLQAGFVNLSKDLERAQQQTGFVRPFASANAEVSAKLGLLDASHEMALGASEMMTGLRPTLFTLIGAQQQDNGSAQFSSVDRIVDLLRIGQSNFLNADNHLFNARTKLAALDLGKMTPSLLLQTEEISQYLKQLEDVNKILSNGPDILSKVLGISDPQDYLILSQNSDELRPSGGYISTFGWMRIRRADLVDYGYSPTTKTSPNPPPAELASTLNIPKWWINYSEPIYAAWDGSWFADFPSTASMAAWYYDKGENPRSPVGGVVSIDVAGFEYILRAIGPVNLPQYNEVVTSDNFREVIYKIRVGESGAAGEAQHKRFLSDLYQQILSQWRATSEKSGDALFSVIVQALQEKHIMIYFKDDTLAQAVRVLGWDGKQTPAPNQDYLMVADANLGSKSNRSIARQLTHDVDIQNDGTLKTRTTVSYDFSAKVAEKDPAVNPKNYNDINYFNSMQVFVPAGSNLTDTADLQSTVNTVNTLDFTDFATVTEVKYDSTASYQFSYTTPVLIEQFGPYRRYRFLAQKQPGMLGENVNVQVSLPAGAKLVNTSPEPVTNFEVDRTVLEFRLTLTKDRTIEILYQVGP